MSYALIPTFALAMIVATPVASYAQNSNIGAQAEDIGMREYVPQLRRLPWRLGKGDGPLAVLLKNPVPDLTTIQKNNAGVFPFDRVYGIVDGREAVAAHGPREMPVWGLKKQKGIFANSKGISLNMLGLKSWSRLCGVVSLH